MNITVFDPFGTPVRSLTLQIEDIAYFDILSSKLPLTPGIWTVAANIIGQEGPSELTLRLDFVVLPLTEDAVQLNGGMSWNESLQANFKVDNDQLRVLELRSETLKSAKQTSPLPDNKLEEWLTFLLDMKYEFQDACQVLPDSKVSAGNHNLPSCTPQEWSSLSHDSKSSIHGLDKETGMLY